MRCDGVYCDGSGWDGLRAAAGVQGEKVQRAAAASETKPSGRRRTTGCAAIRVRSGAAYATGAREPPREARAAPAS